MDTVAGYNDHWMRNSSKNISENSFNKFPTKLSDTFRRFFKCLKTDFDALVMNKISLGKNSITPIIFKLQFFYQFFVKYL